MSISISKTVKFGQLCILYEKLQKAKGINTKKNEVANFLQKYKKLLKEKKVPMKIFFLL